MMRDGNICILFKNKGEKSHLKNYRPITLLKTTLKVLTAVIAKRLSAVMCEISDVDNTAAAPGRFISDNTMLIQMIQAFLDDEELPGVAVWFDMEKCFDLVSWEFAHAAFEAIGFGEDMQRWIQTLYNMDRPATRRVIVNGKMTSTFSIIKSIAQGDSVSTMLQVILYEPLSRALEATN